MLLQVGSVEQQLFQVTDDRPAVAVLAIGQQAKQPLDLTLFFVIHQKRLANFKGPTNTAWVAVRQARFTG